MNQQNEGRIDPFDTPPEFDEGSEGKLVRKDTNPKDAVGSRKPGYSNVPVPVLYEIGAALKEGALKYGAYNWRAIGVRPSIYFEAAKRHLDAWWEGEDIDPDSGLHHLSKAAAGLIVFRDAIMQGMVDFDDRPPSAAPFLAAARERIDELIERYPDPVQPYTIKEAPMLGTPDQVDELRITANLPVSDQQGEVFDFQQADVPVHISDENHGRAVIRALAERNYPGRTVTLWRGEVQVVSVRLPAETKTQPQTVSQRADALKRAAGCPECIGTGWFSPTPVRSDGWPCAACQED